MSTTHGMATSTYHPWDTVANHALPRCMWCHGYHTGTCPKVRSIEYHPNGSIKRVEFR